MTLRTTSATTVVALFALAYAVAVLCIGIVPVNVMIARFGGVSLVDAWLASLARLALRGAAAGTACWLALLVTRRTRGRLTSKGLLATGALLSGVLAGVADVILHRQLVRALVSAAKTSALGGEAVSLVITMCVAAAITLLLLVRDVRVAPAES